MSEEEKRVETKLRPILRKHAGKITEPYKILEQLLADCEEFKGLQAASIKLYWRKDWQADVDGIVVGAQCAKATESERLLAEASDDTIDLKIMLPEGAWPTLDDVEKEHRLYHELCHFAPAKDSNGEQKRDTKDRLLWRLKRHPIVAFHSEITRYGVERVLGHNDAMLTSLEHAARPMEKLFDQAEAAANGNGQAKAAEWRSSPVQALQLHSRGLGDKAVDALEEAGIATCGVLQDRMNQDGKFWAKNARIHGRYREAIEQALTAMVSEAEAG